MSTPNSSTPSPSKPTKRGWGTPRIWVMIVSALGVSLLLFVIIRIQGRIEGSEFSPSHFQQRSFQFYEVPLIRLQITPIRRTSTTTTTANYLRQSGWIVVPNGQPTDWHLVELSRGMSEAKAADARLLTDPLGAIAGNAVWQNWSLQHPKAAAVLWPAVQKLASRELYVLLPSLFDLAQKHDDADDFRIPLEQYLRHHYAALIRETRAAGKPEVADDLLAEAVADFPGFTVPSDSNVPAPANP